MNPKNRTENHQQNTVDIKTHQNPSYAVQSQNPIIFSNNFNKYWYINNFWYIESTKSRQRLYV